MTFRVSTVVYRRRDRAVGISILGAEGGGATGEQAGEWEVGLGVFNVRYGVHRGIVIEKVMSRGLAPVQVAVSVYNALSRVGRAWCFVSRGTVTLAVGIL